MVKGLTEWTRVLDRRAWANPDEVLDLIVPCRHDNTLIDSTRRDLSAGLYLLVQGLHSHAPDARRLTSVHTWRRSNVT